MAFYNCFEIPLEIAFQPDFAELPAFKALNSLTDFFFLLDIIVSFRTTYIDLLTGDEIFSAKKCALEYLQTRFIIDFLSMVPVDTIVELCTGNKNTFLRLVSLLKLVRVTRLGKMIAKMNVEKQTKNILKLLQLLFFVVMYVHFAACSWQFVIFIDNEWQPSIYKVYPFDMYKQSIYYQYCQCLNIAVL